MKVSVALIQTSCSNEPGENLEKTMNHIEEAAGRGGQIVCLQELFNTTYFCHETDPKYFAWANEVPGPLTQTLSETAKKHGIVLLAPIFEKRAPGMYFNSQLVFNTDGRHMGTYRKMHIPDDPGFSEKYYFTPGDSGYNVFETPFGRIGTLICWDQWFPEAARITAMKGADLIVYPTAIGTLAKEGDDEKRRFMNAWMTIQRSHAIANGCFVAGINRVGNEGGTEFWGHSFMADPFGEISAEGGGSEETVLVEIDLSRIEAQRQEWPFFRDRRIDSYTPLLKRWS